MSRPKHVYLCELISREDGSRQSVAAYRSERSARRWKEILEVEDAEGFSSADKTGCVAVIKKMEVRP